PVLHQLVSKSGVAARDLLGDKREGAYLAVALELDAAELLGHPERADADLVGTFKDFRWEARLWIHVPFALPIGADEGGDDLVDKIAAALPHQPLFFGEAASWGDIEHDDPILRLGRLAARQEFAHAIERAQNVLRRVGIGQPHVAFAENAKIGATDDGDASILQQGVRERLRLPARALDVGER